MKKVLITAILIFMFPACALAQSGPAPFSPVQEWGDTAVGLPALFAAADRSPMVKDSPDIAPVSPSGVLYRSLAIPGWGQYANNRTWKALLFFTAEAVCIAGYAYESHLVKTGDYTEFQRDAHRTDRNTFFLYWLGIKVAGMIDAYVDAQLYTFDVDDIAPPELESDDSPKN